MSRKASPRRELGDGSTRTVLVDGSVIGGYRLTFLSYGAISAVYKGEKLGKTVIVKEVSASNSQDVPSLLSEKSLLERLNHPGILHYHSFLNEGGYYYLVLEHVQGQPLADYLDPNDPPEVELVADWAVQLCEIFSYLHRQQPPVIYRDLKPENVLLSEGKLKLTDFGIARLHKGGERQKDTELLGSTATASPEHYGSAETDARSDIYTLGATIYDLLTGGQRKQVGAFAFAPVRELRPEVPPALEAALARSLQLKPADRFENSRDFGDAILVAMGQPPRLVEVLDRRSRSRAPVKKKRSSKLAVFLILLGLGAGFAATQINFTPAAIPSEFPPSNGSHEASLTGDLFAAGKMTGGPVVFMGEDVGLFQVTSWKEESALERAQTLAGRLNRFYQTRCLQCGATTLEPGDIRVGRSKDTGDVVVFYAHIHGHEIPQHGPLLLATVDEAQAKTLVKPAPAVASYWRDMVRDTVALSRGFPVQHSVLGSELTSALQKARSQLKPQESSVENLRKILLQTTGKQSVKLRELYSKVPDGPPTLDDFSNVPGYDPL